MIKDLHLSWTKISDKENPDKQFLDFIISGQRLSEYLGIKSNNIVTPFGFFQNRDEQNRALKEFRLQLKTQLLDNRTELYICACCGDIGCGSITVKIIDNGDRIIWTQFADQSDPDEIGQFYNVADIEFERQNYFKAFSSLK